MHGTQAAEHYKKAAEEAALKAKQGVTGEDATSEVGDALKKEVGNAEGDGSGWFSSMWQAAQDAAQNAQKAAMEVCFASSRSISWNILLAVMAGSTL